MIQILKNLLLQIVNDIDAGATTISANDQEEIINCIQKVISPELTKLESADYIGVSRATFDNYIQKGLLPKGRKRQGTSTLYWKKYDLEKFKMTYEN